VLIPAGCGLAFGAAFLNVGFMLNAGTSVSHLTGDLSKLSMDLASPNPVMLRDACHVGVAVIAFVLGATVSGFLIHHPTLNFSRPYGRTVSGMGLFLIFGSCFANHLPLLSIAIAAAGCGLQNSLATHYRGIVLRTTHVTGLFTDIGVSIGMKIRGHNIPLWKILIPVALVLSFFLGGFCSALVHYGFHLNTILVAGIGYWIAGTSWSLRKRNWFPFHKCKISYMD